MTGTDESLELRLARAAYAEAEQLRKRAVADLAAAKDEHARAARCLRDTQELERNISARERKLKELGEPEFVAREQAVEQKLAEAKALLAEFSTTKNEAYHAYIAIDRREREALAARQVKEPS